MSFAFQGSVSQRSCQLLQYDAITCIELIEHLQPETLDKVPENFFGFIQPKLAIISTPNIEFNVVFNNPDQRLRHWDHKFEWTRSEFKQWCDDICRKYPYTVTYDGVGDPPDGMKHVGYATQFAVFRKIVTANSQPASSYLLSYSSIASARPYALIRELVHPYQSDKFLIGDLLAKFSRFVQDLVEATAHALEIDLNVDEAEDCNVESELARGVAPKSPKLYFVDITKGSRTFPKLLINSSVVKMRSFKRRKYACVEEQFEGLDISNSGGGLLTHKMNNNGYGHKSSLPPTVQLPDLNKYAKWYQTHRITDDRFADGKDNTALVKPDSDSPLLPQFPRQIFKPLYVTDTCRLQIALGDRVDDCDNLTLSYDDAFITFHYDAFYHYLVTACDARNMQKRRKIFR